MAEYKITEIRPIAEISPQGKFYKKYRIFFVFQGREDWIEITEDEYSEEEDKRRIEEVVAEHKRLLG